MKRSDAPRDGFPLVKRLRCAWPCRGLACRHGLNEWSQEFDVGIFLSDGECGVTDSVVRDLCRQAVALGYVGLLHSI